MNERGAPTRLALLRTRRLVDRVDRGAALLRRKREALVRELFPLARPAAAARRDIDVAAEAAYRALLEGLASAGVADVTATAWPPRGLAVDLEVGRVWGTAVPRLAGLPAWDRSLAARATAPGTVAPAVYEAANRFERLAALVLEAAPRELQLRALGQALARTSRQLHTLEQRVAPRLRARARQVASALDEREREEQVRLRHLRAARARR